MRILALSQGIPFPPIGGGLSRTFHLLQTLSERHDLTLIGFLPEGAEAIHPPFPVRVISVPWHWPPPYIEMIYGDSASYQRAFEYLALETDEPWISSCIESPAMEAELHSLPLAQFDLLLVEGTPMARYLRNLPPTPTVLDMFDVHSLMARRRAKQPETSPASHGAREADRVLRFEREAVSRSRLSVSVSDAEAQAARELLGAKHVAIVPNGVDTHFFRPAITPNRTKSILFTGLMSYGPNVESVLYFTHQVFPSILAAESEAALDVVGSNPPPEVLRLAGDHIRVHGRVPDMRPYFASATVVIAPIVHGGGTRIKILEAAACAKPIVSTSLGAEGLPFTHRHDILLADSAEHFAHGVIELLRDEPGRLQLGEAAWSTVQQYSWGNIGQGFARIIEALL